MIRKPTPFLGCSGTRFATCEPLSYSNCEPLFTIVTSRTLVPAGKSLSNHSKYKLNKK